MGGKDDIEPKKNNSESETMDGSKSVRPKPAARKRGRKKKIVQTAVADEKNSSAPPKKRGRPRLDKPKPIKPPRKEVSKKSEVAAHPAFKDMILAVLEETQPASRKTIRLAVESRYKLKHTNSFNTYLNKNLAKMIEEGQLVHPRESPRKYRIESQERPKKVEPASPKKKRLAKDGKAKRGRGRPRKQK